MIKLTRAGVEDAEHLWEMQVSVFNKNDNRIYTRRSGMEFKGIGRTFSTVGDRQYNTIGAFWDELSKRYGRENLRGLGYNWTSTSIEYVIGLIAGEIDGWNVSVSLPESGWKHVKGRTENLGEIYNGIYRDGPLQYEIEMFDDDGNCVIDFVR